MESEESSIERLKRTLYSRNEKIVPKERRTPVSERKVDVPTDWGTNSSFDSLDNDMVKTNKNSFFNKFLIGSFIFFFLALATAIFIFFGGLNMISSNNLDIKIVAPSSVASGEEVTIGLSVINGNRTDLEEVAFFIDYPEGALSVEENRLLSREKIDLGVIPSGGSKDYSVSSILSGEKEAIKSFNFRIEYRVKGSNAVFSKEKTYDVIISSSPIILNVTYPKEINSGQTVNLSVEIISNSNVVLKDCLIKVEYPYGFTYKSSNMEPSRDSSAQTDSSIWKIGDLKSGDKKTLSITGILVGQNLEDRSFTVSAGTQKPGLVDDFDIALATNVATVGIRKSFFDLAVVADSVGSMGRSIPVTIKWQNILPDKILNTQIVVIISGNIFDRSSVRVSDGGFYRSVDNSIVWDKNSTQNLISISPGNSGEVSFSVSSLPNSIQTRSIKNPHIDINVKTTGNRSGTETGVISSDETITVKFPSTATLSSRTYRNTGPFTNTGPIPPKADIETTYTITWVLTNTNNDLENTTVTAILPAGVDWKNEISPTGERLNFDSNTRILSWNIGNVASGTGFTRSAEEVSFKVGIVPSVNQIGSTPNLLSGPRVTARDAYTETQLVFENPQITTEYSDLNYKQGDGVVKQ